MAYGERRERGQRVRIGAKRDGTLVFVEADIVQAVGAYMVGGESADVDGPYQTLYRCPNVKTKQTPAYTNTGPAVAFRAPGYVEGAFALESAMDELARALELDPLALRLKNYSATDQKEGKPYSSPDGLRRCYEAVAETFGWQAHRARDSVPSGPHAGAEKRQRNRRNALAAVAAIERFLPKVVAQSRSELGDIADGLQRLKRAIRTSRRPSNRS